MAIRIIREDGDEVLRKRSKIVEKLTPKISELIEDMLETMYFANGVGLAAPQIGILKRIVTIDVGEGPVVLINPEIINEQGEQTDEEGCLSIPGKFGEVSRPYKLTVKAKDREFKDIELEATELFARAVCHEIDHLDGILFKDKVIGDLHESE